MDPTDDIDSSLVGCVTARRTKKSAVLAMVTISITDHIDEPASVRTRSNGEAEVNPC